MDDYAVKQWLCFKQVYEKKPLTIKNFGIWLRYDSRSGTHNMYREYRDLTTGAAVTQCCECLRLCVEPTVVCLLISLFVVNLIYIHCIWFENSYEL